MIAVCCDHGGLSLKQEVLRHLEEKGLEYKDFGTNSPESCDYPDIVKPLCQAIQRGECDKGVIICGTGIGISMAANKMKGIRAALCHDSFSAEFTRRHNDSNIIAFGARVIGPGLALQLLDIFFYTPFEGGRHAVRVENLMALVQLD